MVREDFIGLSTDTKRTDVANGSTFYCADTSKAYVFLNGTWYEKTAEEPTPPTPAEDWGTVTYVDENEVAHVVELKSSSDLNALSSKKEDNFDYSITIGEDTFNCSQITKVNLGTSVTWLGDYFVSYPVYIEEFTAPEVTYIGGRCLIGTGSYLEQKHPTIKKLELPKLQNIGDYFLRYVTIECDIILPELINIGNDFLVDTVFNGTINITFSKLEFVSKRFMQFANAANATVTLTLPATLSSAGNNFMEKARTFASPSKIVCECKASDIFASIGTGSALNNILSTNTASDTMYTIGVDLDGTYSTDWKTTLPDRTSNPYRKLNNLNG